ncbi:MAG TPA: cupin domain-containing protein [Candidatus Limnocylindria bacterium]|nr:cupin domain-containing protein [Candidatus Limnocylindria bacterium]
MSAERVFLRGLAAERYALAEERARQRAAPRVRDGGIVVGARDAAYEGLSDRSQAQWYVGPGDDPFLTQTIQLHTVELFPGGANEGHGHQNEALLYVIEGRGYEIHDGKRYDWRAGDLVVIHADSVHQHFNADPDRRAFGIIAKAKCAWLYLGLWQQGRPAAFEKPGYGPREDWSALWSPGIETKNKVVTVADAPWRQMSGGRMRELTGPSVRASSVDLAVLEIAPGQRSVRHWHMADEVLYVISGRGHSSQWDVEAEIAGRYYARVAETPSQWEFGPGQVLYVPQNTVHEHVNDYDEPLVLLSARNRLFRLLGYDAVVER